MYERNFAFESKSNGPVSAVRVKSFFAVRELIRVGVLSPLLHRLTTRVGHQLRPHAAQHVAGRLRGQDNRFHDRRRNLSQHPADRAGHTFVLVLLARHANQLGRGLAQTLKKSN